MISAPPRVTEAPKCTIGSVSWLGSAPMRISTGRQVAATAFYVVLVALVLACVIPFLPLPHRAATAISHNSEGYVIALILVPWIQFVRPRLVGRRTEMAVTIAAAVLLLAIGVFLIATHLPSRIRTLNEGFLAAALLVPYVQLRRPVPRSLPLALSLVAVLIAAVFNGSSEVTDLAEVWGAVVLIPIGLDLIDRGILEPTARTSRALRYGWYAFLVLVPILVSAFEWHIGVTGLVNGVLRYVSRANEDFIAALLIPVLLAVILGRTGRSSVPAEAGSASADHHAALKSS